MKRAGLTILGLVFVAIGLFASSQFEINWPWARDHRIRVGPDPTQISEKNARISKKARHTIQWQSNAGQTLGITLHVPVADPDPFYGLKDVGKDTKGLRLLAVPCSKDTCFSGRSADDAKEVDPGYKYDQSLDGKTADGWIIIQK